MDLHELAELFDVDPNSNGEGSSDYSEKAKDVTVLQSFEDKVQDLQVVLASVIEPEKPEPVSEPAPVVEKKDEENDIILNALESAFTDLTKKKDEPEPDVDFDEDNSPEEIIPEEDVEAQVDADIAKAAAIQAKTKDTDEGSGSYNPESPIKAETDRIYEKMNVADQIKSGLKDSIAFSKGEISLKTTVVETPEEDTPPWEEPKPKEAPKKTKKTKEVPEVKNELIETKSEPVVNPVMNTVINKDNPFNLQGVDLVMFTEIKSKYPYFNVYTDSMAWKEFYIYKIRILYDMLFRFPFLDTIDIRKEMGNMKTNHYVGDDAVSIDLLRRRLDDSVRWRTRLSSVLFGAIAQYYSWGRALEMLRGKAYAEHNSRGAYKRDGLACDHLREVELYVEDLHGILEAGKHLDSILKSCTDSLSRQIACIQLREATGFMDSKENMRDLAHQELNSAKRTLASIDELDTLSEKSTQIPKSSGAVTPIDFGITAEPDELSGLGVE